MIRIAIDGPSAAGKSTISRILSRVLSFKYIDTGAMYRAAAYIALRNKNLNIDTRCNIKIDSCKTENFLGDKCIKTLALLLESVDFDFVFEEDKYKLIVEFNGEKLILDNELREPSVTELSSKLSVFSDIREALVTKQRDLAGMQNCVVEGRDIGTVVLPDAEVKIFLIASDMKRAERRHKDWTNSGLTFELGNVLEEIRQRDKRDSERLCSPLKMADDATMIDTTDMTIDDVVKRIVTILNEKTGYR